MLFHANFNDAWEGHFAKVALDCDCSLSLNLVSYRIKMVQVLPQLLSSDANYVILAHHVATYVALNERCILVSKRFD